MSMAPNVFIFVPAYGGVISVPTVLSISALTATLSLNGVTSGLDAFGSADIVETRDTALTKWYDTMPSSTHMLSVDSDMEFPAKLVLDMLNLDEPLAGVLYRKKTDETAWAVSGMPELGPEHSRVMPGNFIEVAGIGMGVTLIRRDCIDAMLKVLPAISDHRIAEKRQKEYGIKRLIRCFDRIDVPEMGVLSEDLSFCHRWRQCGGRVWASVGHSIGHIGRKTYSGSFLEDGFQWRPANGAGPSHLSGKAIN